MTHMDRNTQDNPQKQAPRALPGARAKRLNTAFNRQHFKATPDEILPWALLLFLTNPFYYMVRTDSFMSYGVCTPARGLLVPRSTQK